MSTISDALKKAKKVHYLIELDFDGLIKRYTPTDGGVSVPYSAGNERLFSGRVLEISNIETIFNLQDVVYSVAVVDIEIANDGRLQDEETLRRMDAGTGKIYVWCPGLDWSEIETAGCIFAGDFQKNSHDKFRYSFSLIDFSESRFKKLPGVSIDTDTWPLHRTDGGAGSVAGKPAQIVFGDWPNGIPLPCVDIANFKYLAGLGVLKSSDAEYAATTENVYDKAGAVIDAAGYTFYPGGMDSQGNISAYFDFAGDQVASEPLSCSMQGIKDGSGIYTGTAGGLIENPADILRYLFDNKTRLDIDEIDMQSLMTLRTVLLSVKFATIIKEEASGVDIINRLLSQCMAGKMVRPGGKLGVMVFDTNAPTTAYLNVDHHLVGDVPIFSQTEKNLICNDLEIKYGFNASTNAYESTLKSDRTNNQDCERSFYQYGVMPKITLEWPDVQDKGSAALLAGRFLSVRAFRHDVVQFAVPVWIGFNAIEGDVAGLTLRDAPGGWTDERCILIERSFTGPVIGQKWWRISV